MGELQKIKYDLLKKELCARFPYGVSVMRSGNKPYPVQGISYFLDDDWNWKLGIRFKDIHGYVDFDYFKLCLRSMSNMTEQEEMIYNTLIREPYEVRIEWLYENHFDFNDLISKGVAVEVTKEELEENKPLKEE